MWKRWRQFAHKAAVVQSNVLLFVIYFVLVVPVSALLRVAGGRHQSVPGWQEIPVPADDMRSAHEQF